MKNIKYIFIPLAIVMLLALPMSAIGATNNEKVTFDLEGYYRTYDHDSQVWGPSQPASALFSGTIRTKNGETFLSPLNGTITIDGITYNLSVQPLNVSEEIVHEDFGSWDAWYDLVIINFDGENSSGSIRWEDYDWMEGISKLRFNGIKDGNLTEGYLTGGFPE